MVTIKSFNPVCKFCSEPVKSGTVIIKDNKHFMLCNRCREAMPGTMEVFEEAFLFGGEIFNKYDE